MGMPEMTSTLGHKDRVHHSETQADHVSSY